MVDNTCVYYSRPSRTSNQKRSISNERNTSKSKTRTKLKPIARYKSDSEMKASVCDSYKACPEKVSPSHKSSRG